MVREAESVLWSGVGDGVGGALGDGARACLRRSLTAQLSDLSAPALVPASGPSGGDVRDVFAAAADAAARTLSEHAVRRGPGASWIGLDWLGESELSQLVVLGPDLYKGTCGVALFLAAHAAVTHSTSSKTLAAAALSRLRGFVRGPNPGHLARLGLGGGLGLGSIVYGLAVISTLLDDDEALLDAHAAAQLITQDVISADRQLDVLGGSAGAILGLLRLYRQTGSGDALERATNCGRHLLAQQRAGPAGRRCWVPPGSDGPLNGMSHGAAGYAYALASLASATGRDEFASAATECIAFENASFDAHRGNWADLRGLPNSGAAGRTRWCHGAQGIGLARAAMTRHPVPWGQFFRVVRSDIENAVTGTEHGWPAAPTRCVAARSAASNSCGRPAASSGETIFASGPRGGCCQSSRPPGRTATTGGPAGPPAASILAFSAASPASATRRCGESSPRFPTS